MTAKSPLKNSICDRSCTARDAAVSRAPNNAIEGMRSWRYRLCSSRSRSATLEGGR